MLSYWNRKAGKRVKMKGAYFFSSFFFACSFEIKLAFFAFFLSRRGASSGKRDRFRGGERRRRSCLLASEGSARGSAVRARERGEREKNESVSRED
jgi:hypothetical protein